MAPLFNCTSGLLSSQRTVKVSSNTTTTLPSLVQSTALQPVPSVSTNSSAFERATSNFENANRDGSLARRNIDNDFTNIQASSSLSSHTPLIDPNNPVLQHSPSANHHLLTPNTLSSTTIGNYLPRDIIHHNPSSHSSCSTSFISPDNTLSRVSS